MSSQQDKIMGREAAIKEVMAWRDQGLKVALANGCFDILHVGHLRYLADGKSLVDRLVVAVNSDQSVRDLKGPHLPMVPENERMEMLAGLAAVDLVVAFSEPTCDQLILELKPDYQVKGTDYRPEDIAEKESIEKVGGQIAIVGDPKDHSSSTLRDLINGIKPGDSG